MRNIVSIILEISASFIWQRLPSASVIGTESCFCAEITARTLAFKIENYGTLALHPSWYYLV